MKKFALIWVILSAAFAAVTVILNLEPAATLINWSAESDGSYYIILPFAGIFIGCMIPLFIIMLINNVVHNRKNPFPDDLNGKTGIVVKREKELQGGALLYNVKLNGQPRSKLGMGKKVFIELEPGEYTLQTWMGKAHSPELTFKLEAGKVLAYSTKVDFSKAVMSITMKGEMLLLTPYPLAGL